MTLRQTIVSEQLPAHFSQFDASTLPNGWEMKSLGEIANVEYGFTDKASDKGEFRYVRITDIDINGELISTDKKFVKYSKEAEAFQIKNNDLLMARTGATFAKVLIYSDSEPSIFASYLIRINFTIQIEHRLYWYFSKTKSYWDQANSLSSGSAQPHFNGTAVKQVLFTYPKSLTEQKRIVAVLDEAFSAIAKAKDNAERNLKNAKELFESYLQRVFENKGEDWEEKTVKECVEIGIIHKPLDGNHGEIHPTKADFVSSGVPFIMSRDMENGGVDETDCHFISEKQAKSLRTGFAKDGDVLLSHKGTIGAVSILKTDRPFIVLTPQITFYRIKNGEKLIKEFLYYYFLSSGFQREINSIAQGGSTRAYIGITKQLELNLILAPIHLQFTIVQNLNALYTETKRLEIIYQSKMKDLDELKKSILQKAFSGQL